ncbi:MAG TPA: PDZ domain-containing protein [Candidatus Limnocylindrales bacterium]|nr:PDZ domain-containing protein [Candidatus Limnocylindrales bacterium]
MKVLRNILFICLAVAACTAIMGSQESEMQEGRLLRFPDVYKDRIVFSYAGDLWLVPSSGGIARRITTDPGLELFPKFSPDGSRIAFTGEYDGNPNVYVIPSEGGQPKQLTFQNPPVELPERMGMESEVINWMPDAKSILFLSRRDTFNDWFPQLYTISEDGGLPARLPVFKGGLTSFSPDGSEIAYNRIFRNFRTWKRYTGGMAQRISLYNFKTNHYDEIDPDYKGTDTFPMWHGDTIYFDSDQGPDHRMNLFAYDMKSKQIRQLTHFTEFDVNWPSLGPDAIVFENGGYLYKMDLADEQAKKVTVYLPGDTDQARKRWTSTSKLITSFDISPDGKRAAFSARGDVFTVPAKEGSIRELTRTAGIREENVAWSPDGKWVAYLSDRTGEEEIYLAPQDGMGKEVRVTTDGTMHRLQPTWSPDSKKLLFADKSVRLFYVDIDEKKPVLIDQGHYSDLTDYNWSPDSKWVAYAKSSANGNQVIYLYSLEDKKITPVTTDFTASVNPVFDPDGKYLYFASARDFNEVLGVFDFEFANPKAFRVYVVTLRADEPSPFAPQSDETEVKKANPDEKKEPPPSVEMKPEEGKKAKSKEAKKEEKKPEEKKSEEKKSEEKKEAFRIDLDGIQNRVVALPMPAENMGNVGATKGYVFYITAPIFGLSGPLAGESFAIHIFDMKERKDSILVAGATSYALSFDGKKLLYSGPGGSDGATYGIVDATPAGAPHHVGDGALSLSGMQAEVDPRAEWKEMFYEVYRQERDYFFEASMNGVDWAKERDKYAQLLPYVADRYDLNYILGEFVGELSNSHTYVGGGDYPDLHPVNLGHLGADFEADSASGYYRLKKIYPGENWDNALRSPLTEPGVNVKEGDYILAVNGQPLRVPENPYEAFVNTAGNNVTLTINSKPSDEGARQVVVKPISSEFKLHELDWIDSNREKVSRATDGKVGYVYLPDMGASGLNEFVKQYLPQIRKQGIIFDVRYNGGGFVDQLIFERLRRVLAGMESARNFESTTEPPNVFYGPMVCVTNEYAASDGDFFTYFFKHYKLGPVIGMRTWGGVRGIRGEIPLMDGGYVTRPEFSLYGLDSQWLIENHGVEPDIVIDNTPDKLHDGHDPQLEKAIEVVMKEIEANPKKLPPRPPDLPAYPPGPGN